MKSYRILFLFVSIFGCFQKHSKNRHFSTFLKVKNTTKMHFEGSLFGPSRGQYLVQIGCVLKNANLDQIMTPECFARNFFFFKKKSWNPYFYSVCLTKGFYAKTNLYQIMTPQKAKLGPDNNTTAYIYIYRVSGWNRNRKPRIGTQEGPFRQNVLMKCLFLQCFCWKRGHYV